MISKSYKAVDLMPFDTNTEATTTTYQGFTYEHLAKDYSYDPVGGNIISTYSGRSLSTKGGVMNKKDGPRGSIRLQMNIVAMILHQGFVVEGQEVRLLDKDKSNLRLPNLEVIDPDEPVGQIYCRGTHKDGVVENIFLGCFVARGGEKDAVYYTKTLDEAIAVRESFELTGIQTKHVEAPFYPDWLAAKPRLW